MKKSIVFPLAAIVLLASCEREIAAPEVVVNPDSESFSLCVGIPETKTSFGELDGNKRKVYWSDGDQIAVSGSASQALSGVAAKSTEAVFVFDKALSAPYDVLYPAGIWKDASTVTLPATQTYVVDGIADGSLPMAGYSADGIAATLRYLCAIVNVPVKQSNGNADKVTAVTIASIGNEYMSGDFTIDYQEATLKGQSGTASVSILPDVTLSSTPTNFYVVVPAATYATGIKVIVASENSGEMSKALSRSVALEAGHIYNLDAIEFSPEAGAEEVKVDISSAEDLIQLAQDYNKLVYNGKSLAVTLTADIAFDATSSAAFSATGGLGTADDGDGGTNYFNGLFDGNGKTISGYKGSVPVFAYTGDKCFIKDLTLDNSCAVTFTHPKTETAYYGAVVGYHKGMLSGVKVAADVALAEADGVESLTALGGIAGRITIGSITNCSYSGNISVPAGFATTGKLLIGGLAAYTSNNAANIADSEFSGTISNEGKVTGTYDANKSNPCLVIGGIVGYNKGDIENCVTKDNPVVAGAYANTFGTIVNKTVNAYNTAAGGIVGENYEGAVKNCTNNATLLNTLFKDGTVDDTGRYMRIGGIVGLNRSIVESCNNEGPVIQRSDPKLQSVGGIVGWNDKDAAVASCTNDAALSIGTAGVGSYSARLPSFGGVIGENLSSAVTDVHNTGDLLISRTENNAGTDVKMGGVIGNNTAPIDGGGNRSITNSGKVYFNTNLSKQAIKYSFGGVVGYSEASVQGAENSGYVLVNWASDANVASLIYAGGIVGLMNSASGDAVISNCVNAGGEGEAGEVYVAVKKGSAGHTDNYAGGILGYSATGVSISDCSNTGYVHGGNATKVNGKTFYVGGIAAYLAGPSSVSNCSNEGKLLNDQFDNTQTKAGATFQGGIVGMAVGTAEVHIPIVNVTNEEKGIGGRRGYTGGIVGYAEYADISNAKNSGDYTGGSGYFIGGLAGWLVNSTISASTYSGSSITSSQIYAGGGVAAVLDAGSVIDGCSSYLEAFTASDNEGSVGAAVAGKSLEGSTIKNCHYKSALPICGDANFTDGGGNAADL